MSSLQSLFAGCASSKGSFLKTSVKRTTPIAKMSAFLPSYYSKELFLAAKISGAIQPCLVPLNQLNKMYFLALRQIVANPKSASFATSFPSYSHTRILSSLISRWQMSLVCKQSTPSQSCWNRLSSFGNYSVEMECLRVPFEANSSTREFLAVLDQLIVVLPLEIRFYSYLKVRITLG